MIANRGWASKDFKRRSISLLHKALGFVVKALGVWV